MEIVVLDSESFAHDWVVVTYNVATNEWEDFYNDPVALRHYMSTPGRIYCGYNNKHYDNFILKAICCGATPEMVHDINNFIIKEERSGWQHHFVRNSQFRFDSFDLMDDTQVGTSLKSIEAHLGWDIEETEVDFDLDRPLTPEEVQQTIRYCRCDVKATIKLLVLRANYLIGKLSVGRLKGLSDTRSLYMTNAGLTATFLDAKATPRNDEREYVYPPEVNLDIIPKEVKSFFDQMHDYSIPSEDLFRRMLEIDIDGANAVLAFGGIHHAQPNYMEET